MGKDKAGVNRVILVGRVSGAIRLHKAGKNHWLHFALITEEKIQGATGPFVHEEVHQICAYEQNSSRENQGITENDVLFIQGRLSTHAFTDAEGIKRYKTEIIASIIERISTQNG
ncbi:MAG: single-stranded DNA-binding protein [Mucilaginibacter sp.]